MSSEKLTIYWLRLADKAYTRTCKPGDTVADFMRDQNIDVYEGETVWLNGDKMIDFNIILHHTDVIAIHQPILADGPRV